MNNNNDNNLSNNAMLVAINFGLPRQQRQLKDKATELEEDNKAASGTVKASAFYFRKKVGNKEVDGLATLKEFQSAMKKALEMYARFPFTSGTKLLAAPLVPQFMARLEQFNAEKDVVWTKWADEEFDHWHSTGKERMGDLHDENDFPSLLESRNRFQCEVTVVPLGTAEQCQHISALSPDLAQLMAKQTDEAMAKAVNETNAKNWADLMKPIENIVKVLEQKTATGKAKIHQSLIGNLIEIVDMVPAINLAGDSKLAELAAKAKTLLAGVNPDDLKKSDEVVKDTLTNAKELITAFTPYIRKIGK